MRSRGTMAGKLQIDADKGFPRGHSLPLRPLRPLCAAISIIRVNLFPSAVGLLIRVRSRFPFAALGEIFNSQPVAPKALRRRIHPPSYSRPFAVPIRGPYAWSLFASVRTTVTRALRIPSWSHPTCHFANPDGRRPNCSAVNERWHVRRFDTGMISITRLVAAAAAVFALATLCPAQEPTNLGNGQGFKGKNIEMKDKGEAAFLLSFPAGKEFEATTDGTKNTDVHLYVYDSTGKEVGKDDSPGPKCSVKITPPKDEAYKFVIKNAGGDNTVTFDVAVAK
jgi:hypothetical protein